MWTSKWTGIQSLPALVVGEVRCQRVLLGPRAERGLGRRGVPISLASSTPKQAQARHQSQFGAICKGGQGVST